MERLILKVQKKGRKRRRRRELKRKKQLKVDRQISLLWNARPGLLITYCIVRSYNIDNDKVNLISDEEPLISSEDLDILEPYLFYDIPRTDYTPFRERIEDEQNALFSPGVRRGWYIFLSNV